MSATRVGRWPRTAKEFCNQIDRIIVKLTTRSRLAASVRSTLPIRLMGIRFSDRLPVISKVPYTGASPKAHPLLVVIMSEQGIPDHWESLASSLGAIPPSDDGLPGRPEEGDVSEQPPSRSTGDPSASEQPQPAEGPPTHQPSYAFSVQRTPQDWARLASELGIEVPPEPEPFTAGTGSLVSPGPESTESPLPGLQTPAERIGQAAAERGAATRPVGRADRTKRGKRHKGPCRPERTEQGRPAQLSDRVRGEAAAGSAQKRGKRRRRRHRPAHPQPAPEPLPLRPSVESTSAEEVTPGKAESGQSRVQGPAEQTVCPAEPEDEDGLQLSLPQDVPAGAPSEGPLPQDQPLEQGAVGDQSAEPAKESVADKGLHRAIPCWEEVVGIVIANNMAARAKNPDRRPPGRSPSGRNRGPRDQPAEKAE